MKVTCFFLLFILFCNSFRALTSSQGLPVCKSFSIVVSKSMRKPQFLLLICTILHFFSVTGFGSLTSRIKFILLYFSLIIYIYSVCWKIKTKRDSLDRCFGVGK